MSAHVTIIGRLGSDPELKEAGGTDMAKFSLAFDHGYGEKKKTVWVRVTVFGKSAKFCADYLKKGNRVAVFGSPYLNEWETKEGEKRTDFCVDANTVENLTPKEDAGGRQDDRGGSSGKGGKSDGKRPSSDW